MTGKKLGDESEPATAAALRAAFAECLLTGEPQTLDAPHKLGTFRTRFEPLAPIGQTLAADDLVALMLVGRLPPPHGLSARELSVLLCYCEGMSREEIATDQRLAITTVDTYLSRIRTKTGAHGIAELIRYAVRTGVLIP